MNARFFTPDFKAEPSWWEATPRPSVPESPLPARVDVAVIGSGYTGLCAAIHTARGGRGTVVFDAEAPGWGCSSRNGGQVSTSLKPGFSKLAKTFGDERALAILREGHRALDWIGDFIAEENIDCDFKRVGRFFGAHTPGRYETLGKTLKARQRHFPTDDYLVPRGEQHREIGSDLYHGGLVSPHHASVDPARYHQGLLGRALAAGATLQAPCRVTGLVREGQGFRLESERGSLLARQVIVATSGYTSALTPWHRRRIIPIGSYLIATEPLAPEVMARLIPTNRVLTDSRKLVVYYRASPDGTRVLFGGRVCIGESDPERGVPALHGEMVRVFPELADTRVTHAWMGFVGYTFDSMPHLGCRDGLYYSMGYCGSGVSLSSYFGTRIGQQLLGLAEGRTGLDGLTFETRPFYRGNPWFLGPSVQYFRVKDRLGL